MDLHSPDSLNCLLPSNVANQALKRALNAEEPEDRLSEEDLALAASLEYKSCHFFSLSAPSFHSLMFYEPFHGRLFCRESQSGHSAQTKQKQFEKRPALCSFLLNIWLM